MSIKKAAPPSRIEELARRSLKDLPLLAHKKLAAFLAKRKRRSRLADPIPVWHLGLDQVVGEAGLSAAKRVGWRFFVLSGSKPVAATEIAFDPQGGKPHWSHLSFDPRLGTYLATLRCAASSGRFGKGEYAMRLLRIPSLDLNALLWLKSKKKEGDLLIPMAPVPLLRRGWYYSTAALFARAHGDAVRRLAASTLPAANSQKTKKSRQITVSAQLKKTSRPT